MPRCCHAVADGVAGGYGHRLEAVDAEQQRQTFHRQYANRCNGRGEPHEAATGYRRRAFGGDQHDRDGAQLLFPAHRHPVGIGDEQHAQRHIGGSAVEVERVAGGQHQADALFRAAEPLEFLQRAFSFEAAATQQASTKTPMR